jgi:hypothetical protein
MSFTHFLNELSRKQFKLSWNLPGSLEAKETELDNNAPPHSIKSSRSTEVASCLSMQFPHDRFAATAIRVLLSV